MDQANQNPKGRSTFVPATRAPTPPPVAGRRRGALTSREVSVQATWKRPPNPRDDDRAIKKLRIDTTLAGTQRQHGTPGTDAGRSKPSIQGHSVAAGSMKKLGSLAFAKPVHIPGARSGGTPQPVNVGPSKSTVDSVARLPFTFVCFWLMRSYIGFVCGSYPTVVCWWRRRAFYEQGHFLGASFTTTAAAAANSRP